MDEVDAPLDEANIGRLTKLVAEMSLQTQFVVSLTPSGPWRPRRRCMGDDAGARRESSGEREV